MKVTNDELLTPRDLRREFSSHLTRLDDGAVEKLVLMKGTDMAYVIVPVKTYEELEEANAENQSRRNVRDQRSEAEIAAAETQ